MGVSDEPYQIMIILQQLNMYNINKIGDYGNIVTLKDTPNFLFDNKLTITWSLTTELEKADTEKYR